MPWGFSVTLYLFLSSTSPTANHVFFRFFRSRPQFCPPFTGFQRSLPGEIPLHSSCTLRDTKNGCQESFRVIRTTPPTTPILTPTERRITSALKFRIGQPIRDASSLIASYRENGPPARDINGDSTVICSRPIFYTNHKDSAPWSRQQRSWTCCSPSIYLLYFFWGLQLQFYRCLLCALSFLSKLQSF